MSTVDYNNNQLRFNVQRSTTVIFAPCLFIVLRGRFFLLHGHWQDQAYVTRWTWLHWILLEINPPPFDSFSTVSCDFALWAAFLPSCTILISSRSLMAMASAVGKDIILADLASGWVVCIYRKVWQHQHRLELDWDLRLSYQRRKLTRAAQRLPCRDGNLETGNSQFVCSTHLQHPLGRRSRIFPVIDGGKAL